MAVPSPHQVVLVNMPFGGLFGPSLGLCQLAAVLRESGFSVRVLDFAVRLAERIGHQAYVDLSNQRPLPTDQLASRVFSAALFDTWVEEEEAYVRMRRRHPFYATGVGASERQGCSEVLIDNVRQLRRILPGFLADAAAEVRSWSPQLVGFGSVFQQHLASLALARRTQSRPQSSSPGDGRGQLREGPIGGQSCALVSVCRPGCFR